MGAATSRIAFLPGWLRKRVAAAADRFAIERTAHVASKHYRGLIEAPGVDELIVRMTGDVAASPRQAADGVAAAAAAPLMRRAVVIAAGREVAADAIERAYQPAHPGELPEQRVQDAIVNGFHRLYYNDAERTWLSTHYRGVAVWKCPLDLWLYQEILDAVRPALIVETGTAHGGSAYFLADVCERLGSGRIVTVDIEERADRPAHPRITYLTGSSTDPDIVAAVRSRAPDGGPVLVILDSDHSSDHVTQEMELLGPLVTPGSYLIVEDTNVNGHPVLPGFGPGPMEAVDDFLARRHDFEVDQSLLRFRMTFNPRGYLRRR